MAKQKKQTNALSPLLDLIDVADAFLVKYTGKNIATLFKENFSTPRALPPGQPVDPQPVLPQQQPPMPLADAYAILGLPPTASLKDVERNFKHLAAIFHPDKGGYDEAMKLLNQAYDRVRREK